MSVIVALLAVAFSALVVILLGPLVIPLLTRLKLGQNVRCDGPKSHFSKRGTPTMGGVMIILAICVGTLGLAHTRATMVALVTILGYGALGFVDDFLKVVYRRSLGLRARDKILWQAAFGAFLAWAALDLLSIDTGILMPVTSWHIDLGPWYIPFAILVLISTANAVNLTDGLDGLAAGCLAVSYGAYFIISLAAGKSDLAVLSLVCLGACVGFLVFNFHPARVFMGDTGSMALGAALASLAVLTKTELLLPVIGGVYVIEALSVVIQVVSFRVRGKRIFRMSPLHHHYELGGLSEVQVVLRFWGLSLGFAILGFAVMRGI